MELKCVKKFKILLTFLLIINTVGCTLQNKPETKLQSTDMTINEIPQYNYSDEFFNYNFSKDEIGNCYFEAGSYFYQLDQQNNLKKLFHRLIDEKYWIYDIKYYNGQFYCLVLKVNHDYGNAPLGLATIDFDGSHFQYINDLIYYNKALSFRIVNFRIFDNNVYFLDIYNNDEPMIYTYSLDSNTITNAQTGTIDEKRYEFYKEYFPDFPYEQIQHVDNKYFYQIIYSDKKEMIFIEYDPIAQNEKQYNITKYFDHSDQKVGQFYIDFINNHWFLFSSRGVFMFDHNFENERQLLDESIFEQTHNITYKDNMIIFENTNNR